MNEHPETPQRNGEPDAAPTIGTLVGRIAHAIERGLTPGDVADLRRARPEEPGSPGFWKVVVHDLEPAGALPPGGPARDEAERRWASILFGLAHMGGLNQPQARLGRALAEAGFSELRFARLLGSRGEALLDAVRTTARYLAAKGQPADWADAARLVLAETGPAAERFRRQLARDYYRTVNLEAQGS